MRGRRPPRGTPKEPHHERLLNAAFMIDDPPQRATHFVRWAREQLGVDKCKTVGEVLVVRKQRAELASRQRELIAKIDDAYVLAEAIYPTRTAAELRSSGLRLRRGSDGKRIKDDEGIMDFVVGHLDQALWIARQRLQEQELRAPIRLEGTPPRVDVDIIGAVHKATALPFAAVVRRIYEPLANQLGERDAFVAREVRALQKARQRRQLDGRRNRIDSGT